MDDPPRRLIIYDDQQEVEATAHVDGHSGIWLAIPNWSTQVEHASPEVPTGG